MEEVKQELARLNDTFKNCASSGEASETFEPKILWLRDGMPREHGRSLDVVAVRRKDMAIYRAVV